MLRVGIGRGRRGLNGVNLTEMPGGETPITTEAEFEEVVVSVVNGGPKVRGNKAGSGHAKILYPIPGGLQENTTYTLRYTTDFAGLANDGVAVHVGFGLKDGNDYHFVGLTGDGAAGLTVQQLAGANFNTAPTATSHGAPENGTQAGPNLVQLSVFSGGTSYAFRTGTGSDPATTVWTTEIGGGLFGNAAGGSSFGLAIYIPASETGTFSVHVTGWVGDDLSAAPSNVLELNGEPLILNGEYLTLN